MHFTLALDFIYFMLIFIPFIRSTVFISNEIPDQNIYLDTTGFPSTYVMPSNTFSENPVVGNTFKYSVSPIPSTVDWLSVSQYSPLPNTATTIDVCNGMGYGINNMEPQTTNGYRLVAAADCGIKRVLMSTLTDGATLYGGESYALAIDYTRNLVFSGGGDYFYRFTLNVGPPPTISQTGNYHFPLVWPDFVYFISIDSVNQRTYNAHCNGGFNVFDVSGSVPSSPLYRGGGGCVTKTGLYNNYVFTITLGRSWTFKVYKKYEFDSSMTIIAYVGFPGQDALDFKIIGTYVYVAASDDGIGIISISNPEAPSLTSLLRLGGCRAQGIDVANFYGTLTAFIACGFPGELHIVEVSNPSDPIWLGSYSHPKTIYSVYVDTAAERIYFGDVDSVIRFVAFEDIGFPTFRVSYPSSMPTTAAIQMSVQATETEAPHTYATDYFFYYLKGIYSLSSYTYTEDQSLVFTDFWIGTSASTLSVTLTLSVASAGVLSTRSSGLVTSNYNVNSGIWSASGSYSDVLNVLNPITFTPSLNYDQDLNLTFYYTASDHTSTKIITLNAIPQEEKPELIHPLGKVTYILGQHFFYPIPHDTFYDQDSGILYYHGQAAPSTTWLQFFQSNYPPTKLNTIVLPFVFEDKVSNIVALDNFLYFPNSEEGILTVDLNDIYNPVYAMTGLYGEKMFIDDNTGYIMHNMENGSSLIIVDMTDRISPTHLGYIFYNISLSVKLIDLLVVNKIAFLISEDINATGSLNILDCSDPLNIFSISSFKFTYPIIGVVVRGNRAYLAGGSVGIITMNIGNLASPEIISITLPPASDYIATVTVTDNSLLALSHHGTKCYIQLYNITETGVGLDSAGSFSNNLDHLCNITSVIDNIAYVVTGSLITVLDIANSSNPKSDPLAVQDEGYIYSAITLHHNFLYLLNRSNSLDIYEGVTLAPYITLKQPFVNDLANSYIDVNVTVSDVAEFEYLRTTYSILRIDVLGIRSNDSYVYIEDCATFLDNIWVSSSDNTDCHLSILLSSIAGNLSVGTSNLVTSTFDVYSGWHASGLITDVNVLLGSITFTPFENYNDNFTLTFYFDDFVNPIITRTIKLIGKSVNDKPILLNPIPDQIFYLESNSFSFIIPSDTFFDADGEVPYYTATFDSGDPLPSCCFNIEKIDQDWVFKASNLTSTSTFEIEITAFFPPYNVSDTFLLYVLNFTKVDLSSVDFGELYFFDLLNHATPMHYVHFGLTSNETTLLFDPSFELNITGVEFTESSIFEVSYEQDDDFLISITLSPPPFTDGLFQTTLFIMCNSPISEICKSIPISINILGPIASPNITTIDFPVFSEYDILTRPIFDDIFCIDFDLIPIHSFEYPIDPVFILNASFEISGDSNYFTVFSSILDYNNVISVCISSIVPKKEISATISFFCNDELRSSCGTVDIFASVSPLAVLSSHWIDFGNISIYDIAARNNTHDVITRSIRLNAHHEVEPSSDPLFSLDPLIILDSPFSLFRISTKKINTSDVLITIKLVNFIYEGNFNYSVSLTCNDEIASSCGFFFLTGHIFTPSYVLTSSPFNFTLNEYDILERESSVYLGSVSISPNAYLPIIPSPSFDISATLDFPVEIEDYFAVENNEYDNETVFNIYLVSAQPIDMSHVMKIHCNDPLSSDCGSVFIEGSIISPSYMVSSSFIHLPSLNDIEVVNNITQCNSFYITVNNLLPIIREDSELNCSYIGTDSSYFDFYYSILYNSSGKFDKTGLSIGELRYNITVYTQSFFRNTRTYSSNLSCLMGSEILEEYSIISIPVSVSVFGPYPSLSDMDISFMNTQFSDIVKQTLILTNTGTEVLEYNAFLIEDLGKNERTSFSFSTVYCTGIQLQPDGYCTFSIKFDPTRYGRFDAHLTFITNSAFLPNIHVPIFASVPDELSLVNQLVSILPYLGAIIFGILLIIGIIYCIGKRRNVQNQQPLIIFILSITIYDFVTDILFAFSLKDATDLRWLFYASFGSIAISFIFNSSILLRFIIGQMKKNSSFRRWFEGNSALFTFIVLIATTNLAVMRLIFSRLLGLSLFSCPLTARDQYRLNSLALITHFTEDIPQLAIQGYFAFSTPVDDWPIILVLSLSATLLALVFGIFNRLLGCIYVSTTDKDSLQEITDHEKSNSIITPYEAPLQMNKMEMTSSESYHNEYIETRPASSTVATNVSLRNVKVAPVPIKVLFDENGSK